ncbi:glycoside hydrolase family 3 N-terminal domain-containing protein [Nocardioides pyridinolyticus]
MLSVIPNLVVSTVLAAGSLGAAAQPAAQEASREATPAQVMRGMSLEQRVGQLFMVGTPADRVDRRTRAQIGRYHVGNVMLTGRSYAGVRDPRRVSRAMRGEVSAASTGNVRLFVATDQEGGQVRVLQGPGFSDIPSALVQGRWSLAGLRSSAKTWSEQLRDAGVNMNLAPVLDTVPSKRAARHNPPIGKYDRQFGYTTRVVARHGLAFLRGMLDGGVTPTAKHFPGLGRVHANPDIADGVTDRVTTRRDAYLRPFRAAVRDGVPVVMMSTAYYERIDPRRPAAFSPVVVGTMLRGDLGFTGVVISDDLARAQQVAAIRPAARAVRFLKAGGDLVLVVDPDPLPAMYAAVLAKAQRSPAFKQRVNSSVLRILRAKDRQGLLPKVAP